VGEYSRENFLAFEKEVLGVYISGHPLEEFEEEWRKTISATTLDFQIDEAGKKKLQEGTKEIIGGMIVERTIKYTRTNQVMAFLTVEDLVGTVEVVIFPRDYEENKNHLEVDSKIFVKGRVSEEDEKDSKLICEKIIPFHQTKRELWIQFPDKDSFLQQEKEVYACLNDSEGDDEVVIYCQKERAVKRLSRSRNIWIEPEFLRRLQKRFGEERVKVVEKAVANKF